MQWLFSKYILLLKQNKTKWGEIETNGRKRHFHIDEIASSEQIFALLDDAESADEDDIDNLMNDSNTEFITGEEITQAASTQDTFLTTPEANHHMTISQRWKKRAKKKDYGSYKARRVSLRVKNTFQSK